LSANINAEAGNNRRTVLDFEDNRLLTALFGEHDANLARIEQKLGIIIIPRGNKVFIEGPEDAREQATLVLNNLYERVEEGFVVELGDVDGAMRMVNAIDIDQVFDKTSQDLDPDALDSSLAQEVKITTRKRVIAPRSPAQALYMNRLLNEEMVFAVGPAGTGKTYLAVATAVAKMMTGEVDRIILSRPAVEAGENLGFLPGDLKEKVDPYLRPLYDALYDTMAPEQVDKMLETGEIEIAPLAFMRGRTLSNAYIILDEAQNTTPMQMKMFLTRFGENSRMVIAGDPSQIDLPRGTESGLDQAMRYLRGVSGIHTVRFGEADIVRHPLVGRIVRAYGSAEEQKYSKDKAPKKGNTSKKDTDTHE
jgi:phosphate starvation-inducible PhoH-like protein